MSKKCLPCLATHVTCAAGGALPAKEQASLGQLLVLPPAGEREEEGCPQVQVMSASQLLAYANLPYKDGPPDVLYATLLVNSVNACRYLAEACPDYKLNGFCVLGNECPFAHGVFEINLHPSKYRTQVSDSAIFAAVLWSCALTPPFSSLASTPLSVHADVHRRRQLQAQDLLLCPQRTAAASA